jgi:hypothetical protein
MKIARRFNAGMIGNGESVPKGRLRAQYRCVCFSRPFGTQVFEDRNGTTKFNELVTY